MLHSEKHPDVELTMVSIRFVVEVQADTAIVPPIRMTGVFPSVELALRASQKTDSVGDGRVGDQYRSLGLWYGSRRCGGSEGGDCVVKIHSISR